MSSDTKTRQRIFTPTNAIELLEQNLSLQKGIVKRTILERVYHEATGYYPNPATPECEMFGRALYDFVCRLRQAPPDPYQAFKLFLQDPRNIPQIKARHFRIEALRGYEFILSALDVRRRIAVIFAWQKMNVADERNEIQERMDIVRKILDALEKNRFEDDEVRVLENIRALIAGGADGEKKGYDMLKLIHVDEGGKPHVPSYLEAWFRAKKNGSKNGGGKGGNGGRGSPSNPAAGRGRSGGPVRGGSASGSASSLPHAQCQPNFTAFQFPSAHFAGGAFLMFPAVCAGSILFPAAAPM